MNIQLKRVDEHFRLAAISPRGDVIHLNGSPDIGAEGDGWRPMETLLISLAGCSAIDIINILKKQRQRLDKLDINISGTRKQGTPSPYETILVEFIVSGKIKEEKMITAIELTKTKYCSVYFSLHPDIQIDYTFVIHHSS